MGFDTSTVFPDDFLRRLPAAERAKLGKAGVTFEEALAKQEAKEEKALQNFIEKLFSLRGVIANRSRMDKKKTDKVGWPDFTMSLNGFSVAIEVKLPGKKLDADQIEMRDKMIAPPNNWQYFVAFSVQDVIGILDSFKVKK